MNTDGSVVVGTKLDTDEFEDELDDLVDIVEQKGEESGNSFSEAFGKAGSKIKTKLQNVLTNVFSKVSGVAKGLLKVVTKIAGVITGLGMGLGVTGVILAGLIAGAMILANAFKKVFQENEQVKANLQYIVFAVTKALEPAVNVVADILVKIVNLIIKAIQYFAVFIKMLTGKNIFANASAEAFAESLKKSEESSGKTAKNLKEVKKQLAGFDEMEVLQDTTSSGGAGDTGTGITMPDFDLSNLDSAEKEIEKLKKSWFDLGTEMRNLLNEDPNIWIDAFGNWALAVRGVVEITLGLWEIIDGIGKFTKGLLDFIVGLVTGDTELIKKSIIEMLDGLWWIIDGLIHVIWGAIQALVGLVVGIVGTLLDWLKKGAVWLYENTILKLANWIGDKISDIINWVKDIPNKIKNAFSGLKNILLAPFYSFLDGARNIVDTVKGFFADLFSYIRSNNVSNVASSITNTASHFGFAKGGIVVPRLASGGIINQPGRGVPIASAIGGERGIEGVIPLTDSQQMQLLGEAIGKYITVNASITNTMNGRVISRELQKISAEDDFAFNR